MARVTINQLKLNMVLKKAVFLLRDKTVLTTRTGSPMLRVTLADTTGTIAGVYFDVPEYVAEALRVGQGVEVSGRVTDFKDQLQITLERITPVEISDWANFLPAARRPVAEMERELQSLIAGIKDGDLHRLLRAIFDDPEIHAAFVRAPAAKVNHHACVGGLLEHTLSVARLVQAAAQLYPELNRELALTVALLHDLGKTRAYDPVTFDLTEEGSLWSHLYIGAAQVERAIAGLPGFNPELRLRVVHAILAHHGRLENGSPVLPMTVEALVLHYADHLDGDTRGALDQIGREGEGGLFTAHSAMHETRLYRGAMEEQEPPRQDTLF